MAGVLIFSGLALAGQEGTQKWAFNTGGSNYAFGSYPALGAEGTIYAGSSDGKLYAINPDGSQKWAFTTGGYIGLSSPALGADGTVFVGSSVGLYAVKSDGTQKWTISIGSVYYSSPALGAEGTIYAGSSDGKLHAINPDGSQKWATGGYDICCSPAIGADGIIYVGSRDGKLYAINPDGSQKWAFTTKEGYWLDSSPALGSDGTIYVGSLGDCKLYAINPDGSQKWAFTTFGPVDSSPTLGADGTIYVGSYDGKLYAINPDGSQKWAFTTGAEIRSSPALGADGTVYVGSDDRKLYAVYSNSPGLANSPWPMFHHDVRHTGRYGYITPASNPYLSFSQIVSPQTIGNPFSVTITARKVDGSVDTSFNGEVILSSSVPVGPSFVYLTNGVWSGQANVLGDGSNLVLRATGGGLSGTSNTFSTAGAASAVGGLSGVVTNDASNSVPIAGATVHLSLAANGPDAYSPQTTDASGNYAFNGVASGNYYLWATYLGATGSTSYQIAVPAWAIAQNLVIPTAGSLNQLPVILVPGIMGSTARYDIYPRLKKSECERNQLQLHDPGRLPGWRNLKDILQSKGVTVIECPWDWRKPIKEAMEKYLKEAIKEAKDKGYQKVNIIAHSMGGLLARAYIQSDDYQYDVENLIMVGTPHTGSANAYYIWEGGDPNTIDDIVKDSLLNPHFYSMTIWALLTDSSWGCTGYLDLLNIRSFIHRHVLSGRQLLPTYAFLDDKTTYRAITSSGNINQDLINLNSDDKRSTRMGTPDKTGVVRTRVYYSASKDTVGNIKVTNNSLWSSLYGLYEDGKPDGKQVSYTSGDGTVPEHSATLPSQEGWAEGVTAWGSHAFLVDKTKQVIADYLYPNVASTWEKVKDLIFACFSPKVPSANAQGGSSVTPAFSLTFSGWVQAYLSDAQGRGVGVNPTSGAMENAIPEAVVVTEPDCGSIAVNNPADGTYTISLKGQYAGDFRFTLGYQDNGNAVTQDLAGFNNATTTSFTVSADSTSSQRIIITPPVAAPRYLVANAVDGKAKLNWFPSTDAVASYKIYAKSPDAPLFALIGSTSKTIFMTNDAWLDNSSTLATIYAVVAVKADGTESFFSNRALNKKNPLLKVNMAPILNLLQGE